METSTQALRDAVVLVQPDAAAAGGGQPDIASLSALAIRSLVSLFDEKEQLFAERATVSADGYRRNQPSRKQTMIALMGLHRMATLGGAQPFDLTAIRNRAFQDRSWVKSVDDLGLLTWFTAVCLPERLRAVLEEFDFENALTSYEDGRQAQTAALASFLAGISHARLASSEQLQDLTDTAVDTYRLLQANQSRGGIFGRAGAARFPRGILYDRFGTFAHQMSAIYALAKFAQAFQIDEPLESALACANAMCALQGESGEWWFLYDKRTCRVVSRYPLLALHQCGAAPLGLLALGEAIGRSFDDVVFKGLSWFRGASELGNLILKADRAFVWNSIGLEGRVVQVREAVLAILMPSRKTDVSGLKIQYESRPEHFGWLLYAFAGFGRPKMAAVGRAAGTS